MKEELVRTKSKISSLKREMSSIQQLHLAQQQVQVQLSSSTIFTNRSDSQNHPQAKDQSTDTISPEVKTDQEIRFQTNEQQIIIDMRNLSTSSNDGSCSPTTTVTNFSCSTQTTPLSQCAMKFANPNEQQKRPATNLTSSSSHVDSNSSPSDEQLRLYLTETLQREKDSAV